MTEIKFIYTLASAIGIGAIYFLLIRPYIARKKPVPYSTPLNTATPVPNDKLIVVSDISQADLKEALSDFCSLYNGDAVVVYPVLALTNDGRLAVVFPYDIDFEPFCNMVNYLVYPPEVTTTPTAIGWGTFASEEDILPKEIYGKKAMVFVPEEDENHVQLFIVTNENTGCHIQMFDPKGYKTYTEVEEPYTLPPFDVANLAHWAHELVPIVEKQ